MQTKNNTMKHETQVNEPKAYKAFSVEAPTLIDCAVYIAEQAEDSRLEARMLEAVEPAAKQLAEQFHITPLEAVLMAVVADCSRSDGADKGYMADFLDCRALELVKYEEEMKDLVHKRVLARHTDYNDEPSYRLTARAEVALKNNEELPLDTWDNLTASRFFARLEFIFLKRKGGDFDYSFFLSEVQCLFDANPQLPFVQKVKGLNLREVEFVELLVVCVGFVCYKYESVRCSTAGGYFMDTIRRTGEESALRAGESPLMQCEKPLLEHGLEEGMVDTERVALTKYAQEFLLEGVDVKKEASRSNLAISWTGITEKQLFYNPQEQKQVDELARLLEPEQMERVTEDLRQEGFRTGFSCLFYGAPGTGKTETVKQLARLTHRDIMQVDLASMRSKWVGESEKRVKEIFTQYRALVKQNKVAPILLLNEADGLIGKRLTSVGQFVDKMENTMQNILLQEMEDLEGILIATSNLAQNFDPAFERRFIFKIEFKKPAIDAAQHIWQSLLQGTDDEQARTLATRYAFSGGEIENIARKRAIAKVLTGTEPSWEQILGFCDEEHLNLSQPTKRIGFGNCE